MSTNVMRVGNVEIVTLEVPASTPDRGEGRRAGAQSSNVHPSPLRGEGQG
jgi:hypothetical protein